MVNKALQGLNTAQLGPRIIFKALYIMPPRSIRRPCVVLKRALLQLAKSRSVPGLYPHPPPALNGPHDPPRPLGDGLPGKAKKLNDHVCGSVLKIFVGLYGSSWILIRPYSI